VTAETAVVAPAKINLGLRVLGRRPDGYHLLESVFVPLDLCDELRVESRPTRGRSIVEMTLELPEDAAGAAAGAALVELPTDGRNLVVRAAEAFLAAAGLTLRVDIALVKRIPAGAGLGGGSSDAGAVLRALSGKYPGRVGDGDLRALALSIGADVPFFLDPRPALVEGIGERITPLDDLPSFDILLANPGESVATAEVYGICDALAPALTPPEAGSTMRAVSGLLAARGERDAFSRCLQVLLRNDLEPAAHRLCPPIGRIKRHMEASGALATGMSGSGATVFGVFPSGPEAKRGQQQLDAGNAAWSRLGSTRASPGNGG